MSIDECALKKGSLDKKVVIVTGGGTGIGLKTALFASSLGARVAICGRRENVLLEASNHISSIVPNSQIFLQKCDIRDIESVENFVESVMNKFGRIDVLINNAGGQFPCPSESLSSKGFDAVIRNNLCGTFNMISVCARRAFIPQKRGKVVNVIAQIMRGFPGMVHTGAARAGVENLTKTLAIEWSGYNINVNAVAPGVILSSGIWSYPDSVRKVVLSQVSEAIPLKRLGEMHEVANVILFLSCDYSDYITGQTYYIDGGHCLSGSHMSELIASAKL